MRNLSSRVVIAFIAGVLSVGAMATEMASVPELPLKVNISNRHINRIVTPFADPSIKTDAVDGVTVKQKGSILYFSTTQSSPIAAFVTPKGDESQSIRVTLYPGPIDSQQVELPAKRIERLALPAQPGEASDHVTDITMVLTDVAKGIVPDGFREEAVSKAVPVCSQAGLSFEFRSGQKWQSSRYDLWIGKVTNTHSQPVMFDEPNCYQTGVVGVASYPNPLLAPGVTSEVYVLSKRSSQSPPRTRRASLLEKAHE